MFENVVEWAQFVVDWLNGTNGGGVIGVLEKWTAHLIKEAIIGWIKIKLFVVKFCWGVAQELLRDLGVNGLLSSAWGLLDQQTRELLAWLKVPEGVTLILNASVTKFVMRFVGW